MFGVLEPPAMLCTLDGAAIQKQGTYFHRVPISVIFLVFIYVLLGRWWSVSGRPGNKIEESWLSWQEALATELFKSVEQEIAKVSLSLPLRCTWDEALYLFT